MKIEFNKFFEKLKAEGITQKEFRNASGLSSGVISKLLHNQNINTETICRICDYFHCMPDEIMEFIPDADYIEKQKAKEEVEQQIAELQAKLKNL